METVIKIRPSELNANLINILKKLYGKNEDVEITIRMTSHAPTNLLREEDKADYFKRLEKSVEDVEKGNVVFYTAEEFDALSKRLLNL